MPTVHTGFRRDFASHRLASPATVNVAWRRAGRAAGWSLLAIIFASALGGCTWLGLSGGQSDPARHEIRQDQATPDAFAETRLQMQSAPREPYWPYHLAGLYLAADSSAAAVQSLNTALAIDADYAPAVSQLSQIYYGAKMHAQAVTLLEGYLSRHADASDALRASLALHYEALGEGDKADAALATCAPDADAAENARVLAALRHNDAAAMMGAARRALEADKKSAVNHNNYGLALLVTGRPAQARDEFRAALDIDGALPGALYHMAILETFYFFDDGAGREWFARYRRVASDDPDNLQAHFEAAVSTTEPERR